MNPRLIAITDLTRASRDETLERCERLGRLATPGGVLVQLRDHERPARERLAFGRELAATCHNTGQYFAVNDRLDIALALDADAVHLGEASCDTEDARRLIGARFVTRACHDADRVASLDANGVVLSPILATRKGRPALGVDALVRARATLESATLLVTRADASTAGARGIQDLAGKTLLYALGGLDPEGARRCLAAGGDGIAVIGAWLEGDGVGELVDSLAIRR